MTSLRMPLVGLLTAALTFICSQGCGSSSSDEPFTPDEQDASVPDLDSGPGPTPDATAPREAAAPPEPQPDGDPTRQSCTSHFGSILTEDHGRLDGYLVSIVAPGYDGCNGDSDHMHLQVKVKGAIYDVAVNVDSDQSSDSDVYYAEKDWGLLDGAWAEGWHPDQRFSYPQIGSHSGDFTKTPKSQLVQKLNAALKTVNHVSIFGSGYSRGGIHLIHRNNNWDGAIVILPLSGKPRYLLFRFADQVF